MRIKPRTNIRAQRATVSAAVPFAAVGALAAGISQVVGAAERVTVAGGAISMQYGTILGEGVVDTTEFIASAWPGIPDPSTFFGFDPLTEVENPDPVGWPGTEVAGYYFVDPATGTDTGRTYGCPNFPRATIPATCTFVPGGKLVLKGDGANYSAQAGQERTLSGSGDTSVRCQVVGRYTTTKPKLHDIQLVFNGSYQVIMNVDWINVDNRTHSNRGPIRWLSGQYLTVKHCDMAGIGVADVGGSVLSPTAYSVIYDCEIHDFGQWNAGFQDDIHGVAVGAVTTNHHIWTLECRFYRLGGDSQQMGGASVGVGLGSHHIYFAGGWTHTNGEDAVDVKACDDFVISSHTVWDIRNYNTSSGAGGNAFILHNNNRRGVLVACVVFDCGTAIEFTGNTADAIVIGCVLHDCEYALSLRNTNDGCKFINCTMYNNNCHVYADDVCEIFGCIFGPRTGLVEDADIYYTNSNINGCLSDRNLFQSLRVFNGSTYLTGSAGLTTLRGVGKETNSRIGDPDFLDIANDNVDIGPDSDAIDNGAEHSIYGMLTSTYGDFGWRASMNGVARPATSSLWDIGAYERA
jgi:hypothetical protein